MRIDRILAPNPGPFTGPGTNTWLLDYDGEVIVIDPGPVIESHRVAIAQGLGDRTAKAVVVTHTHEDHAPLANPLARELDVPAMGHAPGPDFEPDVRLEEGASVDVGSGTIRVVHTPGHADDHLCFLTGRVLFTGDHIMGGSSVMVEDMTAYLSSLAKLQELDLVELRPGHGDPMDSPRDVISWYLAHRLQREAEILAAVEGGAGDVDSIVQVVYAEVSSALHPLAARSVRAHLDKLADDGEVEISEDGVGLLVESSRGEQ